jgi:hypothetical protein
MKKVKKPIQLTALLLLIFFVGYYREIFFLVINSVVNGDPYPYNVFYIQAPVFLKQLSHSFLITLKWGLTFLFSAVLMLLTILVVQIYFSTQKYFKLVVSIYGLICIVAIVFYAVGLLFNISESTYPITRYLIGLPQSPLLCFLVFIVVYFKEKVIE